MEIVGLKESAADVDVDAGLNAGQDAAGNTDGDLGEARMRVRLVGCLDCGEDVREVCSSRDLAEAGEKMDGIVEVRVGSQGADVLRDPGLETRQLIKERGERETGRRPALRAQLLDRCR